MKRELFVFTENNNFVLRIREGNSYRYYDSDIPTPIYHRATQYAFKHEGVEFIQFDDSELLTLFLKIWQINHDNMAYQCRSHKTPEQWVLF